MKNRKHKRQMSYRNLELRYKTFIQGSPKSKLLNCDHIFTIIDQFSQFFTNKICKKICYLVACTPHLLCRYCTL